MIRDTVPLVANYYEVTAHRDDYATFAGAIDTDVCVIGGGIAGCSTAFHLASSGCRVVLLESGRIASGASGRSGGQLLPGYSCGQQVLEKQLGNDAARALWDISVDAVQLAIQLIKAHNIACDLRFGHLDAAIKPRHREELLRHQEQLERDYQYNSLRMVERDQLSTLVNSSHYRAGLYDSASAHIHPLNYCSGLARTAQQTGADIYEHSNVISVDQRNNSVLIKTSQGTVNAKFAVLCANVGNVFLSGQASRIMPVATYMIATEKLGQIETIMDTQIAVSDCNFILDYFRIADSRLLFGSGVSYSGHANAFSTKRIQQRMLQVFPQLHGFRVEYAWHGLLDISMNRAPDFRRINNIYYLQGFSGHGLALATMAGKLVADSIAMQSERFDLFGRIKHRSFPGGPLRTPLLMLAMLWYRLRDLI